MTLKNFIKKNYLTIFILKKKLQTSHCNQDSNEHKNWSSFANLCELWWNFSLLSILVFLTQFTFLRSTNIIAFNSVWNKFAFLIKTKAQQNIVDFFVSLFGANFMPWRWIRFQSLFWHWIMKTREHNCKMT